MAEKTYIKGKDRDLESSIESMRGALSRAGFDIEEVSWLNPAPNVYSVHIRDKACPVLYTNGKGSCPKACIASALGEFIERLSCNLFFADYYLGQELSEGIYVHYPGEQWFDGSQVHPEGLLDDALWRYYDPDGELTPGRLVDTNSGNRERGICAIAFNRVRDGKTIWFPVNVVENCYVSNGMSAGNTASEARVQCLSEILERYVKNLVIAEGICLPVIPPAVMDRFPGVVASVREIERHGYHLRIADASLGGQFPVMSVTLINPKDGSVFASFGAHPCFQVALERTLIELLQGRRLDRMDGFQAPCFDYEAVADHCNLEEHFINSSGCLSYDFFKERADYDFVDWNYDADTNEEFTYLCDIIHTLGHDLYIADHDFLGFYACRILVPAMSEVYPVDDLLWNNNNDGVSFRKAILSLKSCRRSELEDILFQLDEGGFSDTRNVADFIGIVADAGTKWAGLRIGELKAMLCLAVRNFERSLEWVNWCLHMEQKDGTLIRHYRCLAALLEIEYAPERKYVDYQKSLLLMYGADTLNVCRKLIDGRDCFDGLSTPGMSLDGLATHGQLLTAYRKLQVAKSLARK